MKQRFFQLAFEFLILLHREPNTESFTLWTYLNKSNILSNILDNMKNQKRYFLANALDNHFKYLPVALSWHYLVGRLYLP